MIDRIYSQYRKPKATAWYNIIPSISGELSTVHEQTRFSYDIDRLNVTSYELDTVGRIVGVNRSFESFITLDPKQFGGVSVQFGGSSSQFGTANKTISEETSNEIFKILIKSKIAKNNNDVTLDGIVSALQYIVGQPSVHVIDNEDMTFSISFGSELTAVERYILTTFDVTPRPQGVRFLGFTEETMITQFGGQFGFGDPRSQFGWYFI